MNQPPRVLITGATGFIGGAVARRWAVLGMGRMGEARVRALVRDLDSGGVAALHADRVEVLPGNLTDPQSIARALQGCDLVVHCAAETRSSNPEQIWRADVEGTRSFYEAAAASGVKRFIFISALGISGRENGHYRETLEAQPTGDLFHDAKLAAEIVLTEAARVTPGAPALVILRFPAVYGSGSLRWSDLPLRQALRGRLAAVGQGDFFFPYLYVDNMVDAVTAAAVASVDGVYNIFDGVSSYADFLRHYTDMAGTKLRFRSLAVLRAASTAREWLGWLIGRYPASNRRALEVLLQPLDADACAEKAIQVLGWRPRFNLQEGMAAIERNNGFHAPKKPHDPWKENEEWRSD